MSLNDLRAEFSDEIATAVEDLNNSLPMSKPQLRAAFTDEELKALHTMISEVKKATSENQKVAKLAEFAKTALGLLMKLGVAL
jgi:hypothetical protein